MIFKCLLGYETIRLGILCQLLKARRERQRKLFFFFPFPHVLSSKPPPGGLQLYTEPYTSNILSGSVSFYSWLSKGQFIHSPSFPQFRRVKTFQVGNCNFEMMQKIEDNEKHLSSDTWKCQLLYPKALCTEKKGMIKRGFSIRNSCSTEQISPPIPPPNSPAIEGGHLFTRIVTNKA